ncbi:MAG: PHP domain-containing protein, partial [Brooklawnia sp.]
MRIDLHTHSWASDGTDSPTRLVLKAQQAGLDVIALTDHDTFAGVDEARQAGRRMGVQVLGGVELSTRLGDHDVHLLGYGPRIDDAELNREMAQMRRARTERVPAILDKLAGLGINLTIDAVRAQTAGPITSLGRPHIADALVAGGHVADRTEAFDRYLDRRAPAYVPRASITLVRGIELLQGAGGAAVIAHPGIRGVGEVLTGEVLETLARDHG